MMNTLFKNGSLKELWKISYPMMINFLSFCTMLFVDRIFLSLHSKESLTASVTAGTLSWACITAILTLAAMSEVFVSQFNGAQKTKELGRPVWQMLWLCLFSFAFFIPVGLTVAPLIFPYTLFPLENSYFLFFMFTGPFFCFNSALAGFFIGRGYPKIIQWMAIVSNLINVILDPIFIFGIEGFFPSFGMIGAAYATLISALVQGVVIFLYFINSRHSTLFDTRNYQFDKKLFISCLKVGIPPAVFVSLELVGWTTFYMMMRNISQTHIFIASILQSILILLFFVGWGLEKGCVAIAGNFIGQKKSYLVKNVFISSLKLLSIFSALLAVCLALFNEPIINWFFNDGSVPIESLQETKSIARTSLFYLFFIILFENIRYALNGILTAAGDTLFLLFAGTASLWIFCFIPTYFFIYLPKASIIYAYAIQVFYSCAALIIVYIRYAQGKWKTLSLTEDQDRSPIQSTLDIETIK
jgi:MATE family multidrug resistance protein